MYASDKDKIAASDWSKLLGCPLGAFPINYLGTSIGDNTRNKKYWVPIVQKVQTKFKAWKSSTLSKAGRLVLIKAVLNAIPTYRMSNFKLPTGVTT